MRHSRRLFMPLALIALAACHDDGVTVNARPPLGGVRFINAVPDGGPVDIRYVDQVEWSGTGDKSSVDVVTVSAVPKDLVGTAKVLIENGCQNQLDLLVASANKPN